MHRYQELKVWQLARKTATEIYLLSKEFPREDAFGLTQQIRKCAISIASNIAEGAGRNSKNEFKHFLSVAQGSSYELETQFLIASDLDLIPLERIEPILAQINQIQKMNSSLQKSLSPKEA